MSINWISIAQNILLILLGAFFGNLLTIYVDKRSVGEQHEIQSKPKVLEEIFSSLKLSLYMLLWLPLFIGIPLCWHLIYQH